MSFDNSYAELGIAISHNKAARNNLDHARGFERQHDWSIGLLDERIFGTFVMLVVILLISAWAFDIQPLIRYAVTIVAGGIFVYCKSMASKRRKDLDELRHRQVEEYSKRVGGMQNHSRMGWKLSG